MYWFGVGAFYALLAWGAFRSRRSWGKLLNYALVAVIGLFVIAIVIPNHVHPTDRHMSRDMCVANLKQLEGAIYTWALEHRKTFADIPQGTELFGETNYIKIPPACPSGGIYRWGSAGDKPTCSVKGHRLADLPEPEPRISEETWTMASNLGGGAGAVAVVAFLLAAWGRGRS